MRNELRQVERLRGIKCFPGGETQSVGNTMTTPHYCRRRLFVFTARCYASAVLAMGLCPSVSVSVRLSQVGVLSKRLNESS